MTLIKFWDNLACNPIYLLRHVFERWMSNRDGLKLTSIVLFEIIFVIPACLGP